MKVTFNLRAILRNLGAREKDLWCIYFKYWVFNIFITTVVSFVSFFCICVCMWVKTTIENVRKLRQYVNYYFYYNFQFFFSSQCLNLQFYLHFVLYFSKEFMRFKEKQFELSQKNRMKFPKFSRAILSFLFCSLRFFRVFEGKSAPSF